MKEIVLLGAGASVDALIPASHDMGKKILSVLRSKPETQRYAEVLSFVAGGLAFGEGIRGADPFGGANVEELFDAVRMLAERDQLDVAPFVGSWHRAVDELDREAAEAALQGLHQTLHNSIAGALMRAIGEIGGTTRGSLRKGEIDRTISQLVRGDRRGLSRDVGEAVEAFIAEIFGAWYRHVQYQREDGVTFSKEMLRILQGLQPRGGGGRVFADTAKAMVGALMDLVWLTDADRVNYLAPLVQLTRAQPRIVVATLNYDNCVELLAAQNQVPCRVGVRPQADDSGSLDLDGDGIVLLKLHGSIDWFSPERVPETGDRMPMPLVMRVPRPAAHWTPALIFGGQNKLRAEWPFFDLFRIFQTELAHSERLTVVGYSFQDEHINQCLSQWLNRYHTTRLTVVDPWFESNAAPYARALRRVGAERLRVLDRPAKDALADAFD